MTRVPERSVKRRIRRRSGLDAASNLPEEVHPVLRRVLAARQVTEPDQLDQGLKAIHAPGRLANMDQAAALLEEQIAGGGRILLVGDFDADGATSVAVALRSLRAMGAGHVDYVVPNRFDFGYGLSPEIVDVAAERGPDLMITVDNGISSIDGVDAARARGIRVLVTDHHLPGERLPAADAIVNPNLPECGFPSKNLAGVGVIFYVMLALRARLRDRGWFTRAGVAEPRLADVLELVALGTVADVVPLDRNNRILVEQGLRRIRAGRACPGIVALLDVSGRDPRRAVASDLAFAVGPRLNAAGRLEDMSLGIECLLSDDPAAAHEMAVELDALNRQRRTIEGQMKAEAMAEVERMTGNLAADALPRGLCLLDEGWHQGVIGIVASRIKERFHRPVVAFAPAGDDELKGS
ncbi:MAG: DHH family phosphoesterase, partial [Ectothiorhodospiraceae bacterium]